MESPPNSARLKRFRVTSLALFGVGVLSLGIVLALTILRTRVSEDLFEQAAAWLAPAVPPILTALLMPIFTPTLSRFRIRRDQLLRIFAYGTTGLGWLGLTYVAIAAASLVVSLAAPLVVPFLPAAIRALWPSELFPDVLAGLEWLTIPRARGGFWRLAGMTTPGLAESVIVTVLIGVCGFAWWWRFAFVALRDYLRLKSGDVWALFLSTQFISMLACLVLIFGMGGDAWQFYVGRLLVP